MSQFEEYFIWKSRSNSNLNFQKSNIQIFVLNKANYQNFNFKISNQIKKL